MNNPFDPLFFLLGAFLVFMAFAVFTDYGANFDITNPPAYIRQARHVCAKSQITAARYPLYCITKDEIDSCIKAEMVVPVSPLCER